MGEGGRGRVAVTPARVLWVLLALVAIVLVAQNSDDTVVNVFGWTISAPLFLVILTAMLIGWGLGTLGVRAWSWRRKRSAGKQPDRADG